MKRIIDAALTAWANNQSAPPLLLRGARRVGKTYSITQLGKTAFGDGHFVYFDFQTDLAHLSNIFTNTANIEQIIADLSAYAGTEIHRNTTLIAFDEIQLCESALNSLRFFAGSGYRIIASGSQLGVTLRNRTLPFPSDADATLVDARARGDPLVGGVEELGQVVVGDLAGRQRRARPHHVKAHVGLRLPSLRVEALEPPDAVEQKRPLLGRHVAGDGSCHVAVEDHVKTIQPLALARERHVDATGVAGVALLLEQALRDEPVNRGGGRGDLDAERLRDAGDGQLARPMEGLAPHDVKQAALAHRDVKLRAARDELPLERLDGGVRGDQQVVDLRDEGGVVDGGELVGRGAHGAVVLQGLRQVSRFVS